MNNRNFDLTPFSSFTGEDGVKRDIKDLEEYLKEKNSNSSFKEKLKVGDIAILKYSNEMVIVKYVQYKIEGIGIVDYAGTRIGETNPDILCIFNQKDIEGKVESKEQNKKEEKER